MIRKNGYNLFKPNEMFAGFQAGKTAMLQGMEKLMSQGGFIQEVIEDEMSTLFPAIVTDVVFRYCKVEERFWEVASEMDRVLVDMIDVEYDKYGNQVGPWPKDFLEWYFTQSARLACERANKPKERFWDDWDLNKSVKRALRKLNLLDERILFLRYGLDGWKPRTVTDVAQLPEFNCKEEYIQKVFTRAEYYMDKMGYMQNVQEEFEEACDLYRKNMKQKAVKEND